MRICVNQSRSRTWAHLEDLPYHFTLTDIWFARYFSLANILKLQVTLENEQNRLTIWMLKIKKIEADGVGEIGEKDERPGIKSRFWLVNISGLFVQFSHLLFFPMKRACLHNKKNLNHDYTEDISWSLTQRLDKASEDSPWCFSCNPQENSSSAWRETPSIFMFVYFYLPAWYKP